VSRKKVFVVVRRTWNAGETGPTDSEDSVPVAAFADRARAEELCARLEREVRMQFDVWRLYGGYFDTEEDERIRAALKRMKLPAPAKDDYEWARYAPDVTPEQRLALWEATGLAEGIHSVIEKNLEG
jgi:hypothetical protein